MHSINPAGAAQNLRAETNLFFSHCPRKDLKARPSRADNDDRGYETTTDITRKSSIFRTDETGGGAIAQNPGLGAASSAKIAAARTSRFAFAGAEASHQRGSSTSPAAKARADEAGN